MSKEIKIYGTYPPYANLTDTHNYITSLNFNYNGQVVVIKSSRLIYGKTLFCIGELIRHSMMKKSDCVFVSPTYGQAQENFKKIVYSGCSEDITTSDKSTLNILFNNGSRIRFFSSNQGDSIRGITVKDLLIIDEAAFIEDDMWYEILSPTTAKYKPLVIMSSTPYFKTGFFYNYFISHNPKIKVFDWVKEYPKNLEDNKEFLDELKKMMPPLKFQTEYLGEWLNDDATSLFKLDGNLIDRSTEPTKYVGLDFGSGLGKDYTVLVGFDKNYQMTFCFYDNKTEPVLMVLKIKDVLHSNKYYGCIVAELNSIGTIYINMLRLIGVNVKKFNTTNNSKRKIIENMIKLTHNDKVKLINDSELINQFNHLLLERLQSGKTTYNAAKGYNDDIVMASCIALSSVSTTSYKKSISFV